MPWIEIVAERRDKKLPPGVEPPPGAADWYRIENSVDIDDSTDVFIYGEIGGLDGLYASEFIENFNAIESKKIHLRLNSGGGSVFEGLAVANAIRSHPAHVTTHVDGLAASIASVIALAGDRVVMEPSSQLMVHEAAGGCFGKASEMAQMAKLLDKQTRNIAAAYAARAGGTVDDWVTVMEAETWYLADEAVAAGLADEAVPLPRSDDRKKAKNQRPVHDLMNRTWDLSVFRYAGRENAPEPVAKAETVTVDITVGESGEFAEKFVDTLRQTIKKRGDQPVIEDAASPSHSTAVKAGTWDAGANEKQLPSPMPVSTAKRFYAAYDSGAVEDGNIPKSAGHLPHHFVSNGSPGAASVAGVRNALARLSQTQGLSSADRSAAEAHLRKHLAAFKGTKGGKKKGNGASAKASAKAKLRDIKNVMRQFDEGDRVAVICEPHDPDHCVGTVMICNGNAYGIWFDGKDHIHKWYVDDELQWLGEGPDHDEDEETDEGGETDPDKDYEYDEKSGNLKVAPGTPAPMPGTSHPYGVPHSHTDDWDSLIGALISPDPQPSSADILSNLLKEGL